MKPGSEAVLKVWREGKAVELKATVAELEDKSSETAEKAVEQVDHGRLGLAVRPLTTEEQKSAQILGGLRVEKVTGPSAKAGIRKGDIVLAVNGQPIKDATHLRNIAEQAGKHLALLIQRGDSTLFVPVQLD
jgi:serine protease Do